MKSLYRFDYHLDVICEPKEEKILHDKLAIVAFQAVSNYVEIPIRIRDCKTGRFMKFLKPEKEIKNVKYKKEKRR